MFATSWTTRVQGRGRSSSPTSASWTWRASAAGQDLAAPAAGVVDGPAVLAAPTSPKSRRPGVAWSHAARSDRLAGGGSSAIIRRGGVQTPPCRWLEASGSNPRLGLATAGVEAHANLGTTPCPSVVHGGFVGRTHLPGPAGVRIAVTGRRRRPRGAAAESEVELARRRGPRRPRLRWRHRWPPRPKQPAKTWTR